MLTRYLIRVHIGPFLFALSAITGLIFLNAVAQRVDDLVGKGLPWSVVGDFLILTLPHTIALSLPMSVLVAVLFAFSEMTASNEIMALAASGIRPSRVLRPLLAMGAVIACVMLYFNDQILPDSNHALKNLMLDIGRKSPTLELEEQVVNEIRSQSGVDRYFLTATRIDPTTNTLEDVTIFDGNDPQRHRTTYAERGQMAFNAARTDLYLTLYDGVVHEVQNDRVGGFQRVYFEQQIVPLRNVGNQLERRMGADDRTDREMGFGLLMQNARDRRQQLDSLRQESRAAALLAVRVALNEPVDSAGAAGAAYQEAREEMADAVRTPAVLAHDRITDGVVVDARRRASSGEALELRANGYEVEIHKKLAIALACMVFTLMGPPLALRFPRGGVGMVVAASSIIFSIYYVGLIAGESLADGGVADPAITMWMSNAVFLLIGLALASRMGVAGSTVRGGGRLGEMWHGLLARLRGRRAGAAGAGG